MSVSAEELLVVGSTGRVGKALVSALKAKGLNPVCFARDRSKAEKLGQSEILEGKFEDVSALESAMAGKKRVFFSCSNVPQQLDYETNIIKAAAKAKVEYCVKLSTAKAVVEQEAGFGAAHAKAEELLKESGMAFTSLRAMWFLQNLEADGPVVGPGYTMEGMLKNGLVSSCFGGKKMGIVDLRDVGEVAAALLVTDDISKHAGKFYDLTGPASVTLADVVASVSEVVGRPIACKDLDLDDAISAMAETFKIPVEALGGTKDFLSLLLTECDYTTNDVEEVTGKPARPFSVYVKEKFSGQ